MNIEVYSKHSQAKQWVMASLKRNVSTNEAFKHNTEYYCEIVSKELDLDYAILQDNTIIFKDKILQ